MKPQLAASATTDNRKTEMTVKYKNYSIDVSDDQAYSINSADNTSRYDHVYFDGATNEDRVYPTSKHGIRVRLADKEVASALISEVGGATTIHNKSFVIADNSLLICCCDKVYSLNLPDLSKNWSKRIDPDTCFGIYSFDNDFIVHGELCITRIDKNGNEKWQFGAQDIWVTPDGKESFSIQGDKIFLTDWEGYKYILDKNGVEVN